VPRIFSQVELRPHYLLTFASFPHEKQEFS
jgi:hypothetical protein